ncbi:MAG: hypothetical protein L0Y56_14420, partial [Nitrospira sp.]|nr:hypothetical protein [Nitrospira sp.]
MVQISLKRLVSRKEIVSVICDLIRALDTPIGIQDASGKLLLGDASSSPWGRYPVQLTGEVIGWVTGGEKALAIASLLNYLATHELEKKTLAWETLDKYKELNLLYEIADKVGPCLD